MRTAHAAAAMRQPFESIERQIELMFELQFYNMGLALSIFEEGIARLAAAAKVQADAQPRATPQRLTPYPPTATKGQRWMTPSLSSMQLLEANSALKRIAKGPTPAKGVAPQLQNSARPPLSSFQTFFKGSNWLVLWLKFEMQQSDSV
jgi:hypothetical protein